MACTSMYGARTSESPCAFMIDVFMSWTSLAISEPETRSRVCPASSLMLHKRWRRISKVTGSTRVGSVETASIGVLSDGQTSAVMLLDAFGSGALRPPRLICRVVTAEREIHWLAHTRSRVGGGGLTFRADGGGAPRSDQGLLSSGPPMARCAWCRFRASPPGVLRSAARRLRAHGGYRRRSARAARPWLNYASPTPLASANRRSAAS